MKLLASSLSVLFLTAAHADTDRASTPALDEVASRIARIDAGQGSCSASFIDAGGYMLTAAHCVLVDDIVGGKFGSVATNVDVWTTLGATRRVEKTETARVLRVDRVRDLALLKVNARDGKPAQYPFFPINRAPKLMSRVRLAAFPQGAYRASFYSGELNSIEYGAEDQMSYLMTDVHANPGTSGGALLDEYDQLIGVLVQGTGPTRNIAVSRAAALVPAEWTEVMATHSNEPRIADVPALTATATVAITSDGLGLHVNSRIEHYFAVVAGDVAGVIEVKCSDGSKPALATVGRGRFARGTGTLTLDAVASDDDEEEDASTAAKAPPTLLRVELATPADKAPARRTCTVSLTPKAK